MEAETAAAAASMPAEILCACLHLQLRQICQSAYAYQSCQVILNFAFALLSSWINIGSAILSSTSMCCYIVEKLRISFESRF